MAEKRESANLYILGAGLLFYLISAFVVVFAPWMDQAEEQTYLTTLEGEKIETPELLDSQKRGREIYLRENCLICHSQVVRGYRKSVDNKDAEYEFVSRGGDEERYGPISQPGESGREIPQLFGTRRIGPDLARVGGKYADAWHISHFLDPQSVVPGSIMPKFTWLYAIERDEEGKIVKSEPTVELMDLISYVQTLGTYIGDYRGTGGGGAEIEDLPEWVAGQDLAKLEKKGSELYVSMGCVGCHGESGYGDGAAAANFPESNKPRNYHDKEGFKWGWDLPTVAETIKGGRLPYMPSHPQLNSEQVAALAVYVRSFAKE